MHGQASIWAISRLDLLVLNLDSGASHGFDGLDWLRPEMNWKGSNFFVADIWKWRSDHKLLGKFRFSFKLSKLPTWHPKITQKSFYQEWYWFHCPAYRSGQWWRGNLQNDFGRSEVGHSFFSGSLVTQKSWWEFDRIFDIIFRIQGGIPSKRWHMVQAIISNWDFPRQASPGKWIQPFPHRRFTSGASVANDNGQTPLDHCRALQTLWVQIQINDWVVVSNIFYFQPYLGKIPNLTNIFGMDWNHQPDSDCTSWFSRQDFALEFGHGPLEVLEIPMVFWGPFGEDDGS